MPTMDHENTDELRISRREKAGRSDYYDDDDLKTLAEDIVRYCPSLTHLLLAMGKPKGNPLEGLN